MGSPERTGSGKDGTKMDWMYKGPTALVDRDDYLKGRSVDKTLKMLDEAEKGNKFSYADEVEKDLTPISIFSSRGQAGPIDVIRKIKEDPLFQIQKKEEEHLRQLLNNPVRMKRLRDMAEKSKKDEEKSRKKRKKKRNASSSSSSSSDDSTDDDDDADIDKILAEKLKSMKDVKEKLASKKIKAASESSSDDDHRKSSSSKRSKVDGKSTDRPHSSSTSSSRVRESELDRNKRYERERDSQRHDRDRDRGRSSNSGSRDDRGSNRDRDRRDRDDRSQRYSKSSSSHPPSGRSHPPAQQKKAIDDAERERRMKEMMENAKWREEQRTHNVNKHREEVRKEEEKLKAENNTDFIRKQLVEAASTGSIEKRIKSNSYNIQRSKTSMNQNFAKR